MGARTKAKAKAKPKGKAGIGKRGVSSKTASQTYVDVTGNAYVEVDSFVPQYDEIGVLPPIGRWDPLKIREQVICCYTHPVYHSPWFPLLFEEAGSLTTMQFGVPTSVLLLICSDSRLPYSFDRDIDELCVSHAHRDQSVTAGLWKWRSSTAACQWLRSLV